MDNTARLSPARFGRKPHRPPQVEETLGSRLFAAIWFGPHTEKREALLQAFKPYNCSNWARCIKKPTGDFRPRIEKLAGIAQAAWSEPWGAT